MIERQELQENVIAIMKNHVGKDNAIPQKQLFIIAANETLWPNSSVDQTRPLRSVIRDIRKKKLLPLCSGNQGYWLAESDAELEAFTVKLLKTAERQFGLARDLSKVPVSRMIKQHKLNFKDEENNNDN